ncbi:hypothetical protein OG883_09935 [Streptomyces sp. NBC_01142]|uniref:hypothetical protein n=1 Tax=Streptomyces sp. NBC_01142 TaxID=2975865 RepID=UPI002255E7E8|nr:hypothetical protein [Streptomyces sp. NBC_01142]MCX4820220.1 hypothetical protein [Streptomyces sp. NBC_01142]
MANVTGRGSGVASPARRSMAAAARAAARRTERVGPGPGTPVRVAGGGAVASSRTGAATDLREPDTVRLEAPDDASQGRQRDDQHAGPVLHADDPVRGAVRGRRRALVSAVLALVVVAGLVVVAVLGREYGDGRRADRARVQALAAAQKAAPAVLSYDYRHLDRDFAAARGHLTGSFRDEYRKTTTTVVAPTAGKYHGVVRATVVKPPVGGAPAASVVSASPDRAVVLLFVNQVTRSTQVSAPRVDLNRVRMTLTLTSGGWKVSAVDAL